MINKIFLEKLTLIGFRKNYEVNFKEGLNFISGPLSTGKSSIAEMINYALGSDKHKAYIEIRKSCRDVELVLFIGENKYKITRPLFDFNRPVKLFKWNNDEGNFEKEFLLLEIDTPSNKKSLSAFLLKELGLPDIKVANQSFSFRDLFKYCYVSQSNIDSENLLMEKVWSSSLKRKPTFEIIFSIYNELLGDLKQQLKSKTLDINTLEKKRDGVYEFLKDLKLIERTKYLSQKLKLIRLRHLKTRELTELKSKGTYDGKNSLQLEHEILYLKNEVSKVSSHIKEKEMYIEKLILLRNQYSSDIQKIEFILEGAIILNTFEFEKCPSCMNEIVPKSGCSLCGSELDDLTDEETKAFQSELRRVKTKSNSLLAFIERQQHLLHNLKKVKENIVSELESKQREIEHLRNQYISPFIEQIEKINYEVGVLTNNIDQLEKNLNIIDQFEKLNNEILHEEGLLEGIKAKIKGIEEDSITKEDVILNLSNLFNSILEEFSFPKLDDAYIKDSDYLPYVRGVKYDELGSGGAVTMTTMAYFLSIALLKSKNKNHPGLLIIDSPRKNLGADAKNNDEFKDEAIFNSIIKYFNSIFEEEKSKENQLDKIQLIIISNGNPEYLDSKNLIVNFDGDGTKGLPYGLIDDIENL
ncbi:AAA family ATPase [Cytobacillus praedii]|uniref:AAA family ATPase n=1 Tax=Cytobacillus praedii TaxID=1742358 RepID=UPI002E23061A|nr:AAA family ATPase [Cytobacillus praedii]MED3550300.1 AAA family ATPase [Cytobacillus praedii]